MTAPVVAPPKIVRIIARLNVGGPAQQAILLHEALRRHGFETRLVHGSVADGEASMEDRLDERALSSHKIAELGRHIRPASDLNAFRSLTRYLFAERPDIVHTHTAKAGTLGRLAAAAYNATRPRRDRCLVVHTFHGHVLHGYFGAAGSLAVRAAESGLARLTDRVITISPRQREDLVERYGVAPAGKVRVVPLGLDLDAFLGVPAPDGCARARLGFPPDSIVFGVVGRLVAIKNLPLLLEATAQVVLADPRVRVAVVGDGEERDRLEALAKELALADKVRFLGWQRALPELFQSFDAVALTSLNEGTPVALIEAMAAGRPAVATAVGGVPDVVSDDETGLLVAPGDRAALAEAMLRISRSPADRQRWGTAAHAAAARYRSEALIASLAGLYREGLREKRGL